MFNNIEETREEQKAEEGEDRNTPKRKFNIKPRKIFRNNEPGNQRRVRSEEDRIITGYRSRNILNKITPEAGKNKPEGTIDKFTEDNRPGGPRSN